MKQLSICLLLLASGSCATIPSQTLGDSEVRIGELAYIDGLQVTPLHITEDSRCAIDTQCVWEGRLILHIRASGYGDRETLDLQLGVGQNVAGGILTLISARPDPVSTMRIAPEDYRFAFTFNDGD